MQRSVFFEGGGWVCGEGLFLCSKNVQVIASLGGCRVAFQRALEWREAGLFFFPFRKMLVTNPHVSALGNCSIFV